MRVMGYQNNSVVVDERHLVSGHMLTWIGDQRISSQRRPPPREVGPKNKAGFEAVCGNATSGCSPVGAFHLDLGRSFEP